MSPTPLIYSFPVHKHSFLNSQFSSLSPHQLPQKKQKQKQKQNEKMIPISSLFLATLLLSASLVISARPESSFSAELKHSNDKPTNQNNKNNKGGGNGGSGGNGGNDGSGGMGGFFGPGFDIPGFGKGFGSGVGGGYGGGYGGPNGGYSKGGTVRTSLVCKEKGPCYKKKLTCPAKCFTSYSRSGKGYGGGGGGGGCTIDCKKKCSAYC